MFSLHLRPWARPTGGRPIPKTIHHPSPSPLYGTVRRYIAPDGTTAHTSHTKSDHHRSRRWKRKIRHDHHHRRRRGQPTDPTWKEIFFGTALSSAVGATHKHLFSHRPPFFGFTDTTRFAVKLSRQRKGGEGGEDLVPTEAQSSIKKPFSPSVSLCSIAGVFLPSCQIAEK